MAAVSALFREFAAMAVFGGKVSRFGIRVLESDRVWDSNVKTYFRKRKRAELDGLVASMAKRRSSSISGNGIERDKALLCVGKWDSRNFY
nr:hypothetical protein CFP56_51649 [Quercus suber]